MPPLFLPALGMEMLQAGMDVAISISGGKDSQAMLTTVVPWFRAHGWTGSLYALHTSLGRAERTETPGFLSALCTSLAVPLVIVRPVVGRGPGDLQDALSRRMLKLGGTNTPFWPTMGYRYCTSLKRGACDKQMRGSPFVLSCEGIRATESDSRAEKEPFSVRTTITGERYKRLAPADAWRLYREDRDAQAAQYTFFEAPDRAQELPRLAYTLYSLFEWSEEEVWLACGTSLYELEERRAIYQRGIEHEDPTLRMTALAGWPAHPASIKLARRLSCTLCGISSKFQACDSPEPKL